MVTDYERAWVRLAEFVASKTQHGREGLLTEMATIAAECRVPAGELSRLLRLYGVEVERVRSVEAETRPDGPGDFDGGFGSSSEPVAAGHHRLGGHDGSGKIADGRAGANGRRTV